MKFALNVGHAHDVGDHLFVINGLLYAPYKHVEGTIKHDKFLNPEERGTITPLEQKILVYPTRVAENASLIKNSLS